MPLKLNKILEEIIPHPCFDRPFVCDGLPDHSEVIVIGENPGNNISVDWWSYWQGDRGFDYSRFLNDYKKRKPNIRGVRARLVRIRENGVKAIETNVYRNQQQGGAGQGVSNYDLLRALLESLPNLRAVILHGKIAQSQRASLGIKGDLKVFETDHFRSLSYSRIDDICRQIRDL